MFAQVAIKSMGARRFTYRIPEGVSVEVGDRVIVNLKGREREAVVALLMVDCPLPPDRIRDLALPGEQPSPVVANPRPGPVNVPRPVQVTGAVRMSKRAFFDTVGYKPHRGQEQIHGAFELAHVRNVVAVCGTRFGKTMAAAHEMAFEAIQPRPKTAVNPDGDFKGWCVGPTHKIADIVFDMIAKILRVYLKGHVHVSKSDGRIEFTNLGGSRSIISRRTTQDAAGKGKLVGEAVDFMVIDEAASISDPRIWTGDLSTRLMDRHGRALHISSPRGVEGYFAELYRSAETDSSIIAFKMPTWTNPFVPREEILYRKRTMPPRVFEAEVGAELLADSGMVFERANLELMFCMDFEDPRNDADYFAAIDLAVTNDFTVLTIARAPLRGEKPAIPRVVYQERFYKMPIEMQLSRMHAMLDAYNGCTAVVDHNGIGQSIYQQMTNRGMSVRPLYTTGAGKNSKKDLVMNASAIVDRRAIYLPKRELAPNFWDEMVMYQWEQTPSGNLTANAPSGAHDDTVACFVLLCSWMQAAGTTGEGQIHHVGGGHEPGPAPAKLAAKRPELIARGDALPSDDDAQVYNPRTRGAPVRLGKFRGGAGGLFRPW